jgi:CRP/FNR family transcriptional regulator, anaerobic regulatory protein
MMDTQPILKHFESYVALNEQETRELGSRLFERNIKRKQFILQAGDVCTHYTFVVKGCFKMYKVDTQGNEHNLQFSIENGWIGDMGSFYSEKPSELYIEAMEASIVLQIVKPDLLYLFTNYHKFNFNFRVLIENAFIRLQKRVLQNISSTAEERYLDFIQTYPSLFNRISNVQIASYLGITPEFLSKIRKDLASKQ